MFNSQAPNFSNPLWNNGPQPGQFYNFPGSNQSMKSSNENGTQRSAYPIATGSSVVGIKYDEDVLIAADTLVSYGSLTSFRNVDRVFTFNDNCILGAGADYADFQCVKHYIDEKITEDFCYDDKIEMKLYDVAAWKTRQQLVSLTGLRAKENEHLKSLDEWFVRQHKEEEKLAAKMKKCKLLTEALEHALSVCKEKKHNCNGSSKVG